MMLFVRMMKFLQIEKLLKMYKYKIQLNLTYPFQQDFRSMLMNL